MKNIFILILIASLAFTVSSCDSLLAIATEIENSSGTTNVGSIPLTKDEVINGLKEALRVSTDTAVSIVSKSGGFLDDNLIKILLPPEADIIMEHKDDRILKTIGVTSMIDEVIVKINRSAEDATKTAGPIFLSAIKSMSFTDAFAILNGGETAATEYFKKSTTTSLKSAFKPVINKSLDKPVAGNISTNKAWTNLTSAYNKAAQFSTALTPVNSELDDFVTQKAVDGLFTKLAIQEQKIRKDPVAQVTSILKRVFGV